MGFANNVYSEGKATGILMAVELQSPSKEESAIKQAYTETLILLGYSPDDAMHRVNFFFSADDN